MTRQNLKTGTIWSAINRFGGVALAFAVNLVLTRILSPEDFGLMGVLLIFISISEVLLDGGFTAALIRKKDPTPTDYTTYGVWAFGLGIVFYVILYLSAPLIGDFFATHRLVTILRWWGLDLIMYPCLSLQTCYLRKEMRFRALALCYLAAYVLAAATGIVLALKGTGVMSIVIMYLVNPFLCCIFLSIPMRRFRPGKFSRQALADLFRFGGYMLGIDILKQFSNNLQSVIIGKRFTISDTGLYTQAFKLNQVCNYHIPIVISMVLFPVLSSLQDNRKKLLELLDRALRVISLLVYPVLGILILYGDYIVDFLYGEKWHAAGEYFRILTVSGFFVIMESTLFHAVASLGRSRQLFAARCYILAFLIGALCLGSSYGIRGLLWGINVAALNSFIVHALLTSRYTGYRIISLLKAIFIPLILTLTTSVILWTVNKFMNNVILSILLYMAIYILSAIIFRVRGMEIINLKKGNY